MRLLRSPGTAFRKRRTPIAHRPRFIGDRHHARSLIALPVIPASERRAPYATATVHGLKPIAAAAKSKRPATTLSPRPRTRSASKANETRLGWFVGQVTRSLDRRGEPADAQRAARTQARNRRGRRRVDTDLDHRIALARDAQCRLRSHACGGLGGESLALIRVSETILRRRASFLTQSSADFFNRLN